MSSAKFFEGSAQGRLDVMGGIADYSGSLVMQMPIRERTTVRFSLRNDFTCNIKSTTASGEVFHAQVDYRSLLNGGEVDYPFAQRALKAMPGTEWIAYVVGCALVLQKEKQIDFKGGDFLIESTVPLGKGVSSSASLEVATMKALAKAFVISFSGTELPMMAQRTENLIVGAPCGLMDQLSCYFGEPRKFLPIVCQPDRVEKSISIPEDIFFLGIDSGVRHSVGGSSYTDVRCATFMGYTILARQLGASRDDINNAIERHNFSALPFGGYLCNISVREFESKFNDVLPERISGKEFISLYGNSIDPITIIENETNYAVRTCAAHPIYENERVSRFKQLALDMNVVTGESRQRILSDMGELMYQSHEAYSRCGIGSDRTTEIVELAKALGPAVYGAKITGGGSGGTVCILAEGEDGRKSIAQLHQSLCKKYNDKLTLFEN